MMIPEKRLRPWLRASYACGGPRLWSLVRGGRTKVLMYHGVPQRERFAGIENWYGYQVPVAELERHLVYLQRTCHVVSLRDFRASRDLSARKTNVVLTFDDGYENNYSQAFPLLRRLGLPATFALATGFVRRREPLYNDVIEYAVLHTQRPLVRLRLGGAEREFAPVDAPGRLQLYDHLMYECVRMEQEGRPEFLAAACAELGVGADPEAVFANPDYRPLTPAQVRAMAQDDLVEIASHSVHHYLLSRASADTKRSELRESRREVEEMTGKPCLAFCVPGGAWDREMVELAFAAGYDCVLNSDGGTAARGQRVLVRNGVFHQPDLLWFADMVRGPVQELVGFARRVKQKARAAFHAPRQAG